MADSILQLSASATGVTVAFRPATPSPSSTGGASSLTYSIYLREVPSSGNAASDFNWDSPCGLRLAGAPSAVLSGEAADGGLLSSIIAEVETGKTYRANVLVSSSASADGSQGSEEEGTVYASSTISVGGGGGGGGGVFWILLVAVPLGGGLLVCIYRLYQSNRVLNAQLDIEMEDVPRSAIIKAMKGYATARPPFCVALPSLL